MAGLSGIMSSDFGQLASAEAKRRSGFCWKFFSAGDEAEKPLEGFIVWLVEPALLKHDELIDLEVDVDRPISDFGHHSTPMPCL